MIRMSTVGIIVGVGLTSVCLYGIYLVEKAHKLYEENLTPKEKKIQEEAKDMMDKVEFYKNIVDITQSETREKGIAYFRKRLTIEEDEETRESIKNLLDSAEYAKRVEAEINEQNINR